MKSSNLVQKKIKKEIRYVQKIARNSFLFLYTYFYKHLRVLLIKPYQRLVRRVVKLVSKKYSIAYHFVLPKHLPRSLGFIFSLLFIFVLVYQVSAVTPNPGHPWTEVGDGLVIFSTPSTSRTYTLPDATTNIVTATSGAFGYGARWITSTVLGTSTLIDNGTVLGINATSSTVTLNVQGTSTLNPFNVASSTGTSLFTVLANGNVGVGTTTGGSILTLASSTLATGGITFGDTSLYRSSANALTSTGALTIVGTSTHAGGATISAFSGGSWIDLPTTGPSGIGSGGAGTNPFVAYAQGGGQWFTNAVAGDIAYRNTTGRLLFGNTANSASMILSGDKLGLGSSTPGSTFSLTGTAGTNPLYVASSTGAAMLTMGQNGRLGIGTSTSPATLAIQGTGAVDPFTIASSTGVQLLEIAVNGRLGLGGTTTPSAILSLALGTTATSGISFGDLSLYRSGAQTLTTSGSLVPLTDLTFSLGANATRFLTFFSQSIFGTSSVITNASSSNFALSGKMYDSINATGTAGSVLQSTGTSTLWVAETAQTTVTRPLSPATTGGVTGKGLTNPGSLTTANIGMFSVPAQIVVNQISFTVTAVTTAGTAKICVYNEAGTKVIDVTTAALAVSTMNTAVSAVTLPPGNYYIVQLCATACVATTSYFTTTAVAGFNAATVPAGKKVLEGTGTMTSGTCNATLPTITPAISSTVIGRLDN